MKKSPEQRIAEVSKEDVAIVNYDPKWPRMFEDQSDHLRSTLPGGIVKRIEHFGSTAVPGLPAMGRSPGKVDREYTRASDPVGLELRGTNVDYTRRF